MNDNYLADVYRRVVPMLQGHLADLNDADMLQRPAPSANHAAWQVGHLISSTGNILNMITPGAISPLPENLAKIYGKDGCKMESGFESKQQQLERFAKVMDGAVAWLGKLTDADKAKPTPQAMQGFAKTVGELAVMLPVHIAMHVGQIQVLRRKLGKPILF